MVYLYSICRGDVTKFDYITKMNFVFTMNFKSFEHENPDIVKKYGKQ